MRNQTSKDQMECKAPRNIPRLPFLPSNLKASPRTKAQGVWKISGMPEPAQPPTPTEDSCWYPPPGSLLAIGVHCNSPCESATLLCVFSWPVLVSEIGRRIDMLLESATISKPAGLYYY
ncbi:uncharacterized protein LOC143439037 [Arvicanthis niloticus]|uniref:uncharacterized protein LOC143310733 n=1 Tax=Arvicanthis niloticus TaxID=61156 RepID=UPI00402BE816